MQSFEFDGRDRLFTDVPEDTVDALDGGDESIARRDIPGSTAFVPSVAGLIIAGEVVRDLCREYIAQNAENALK